MKISILLLIIHEVKQDQQTEPLPVNLILSYCTASKAMFLIFCVSSGNPESLGTTESTQALDIL